MPGILFTNALLLAGLTALAIPVLIHLLLKRKKKRLRFSTLQFFLKQDEQSSQKRKLRNWLLLAMRLLIFTLLVLGFARPYLRQTGASGNSERKRQVIVVLDRSASMLAVGANGTKWKQAKEKLQKVLSELKPNDRAALIGCSTRTEVISAFAPAAAVSKVLADLEPSYGTSNLGEGLQQAVKLLSIGDSKASSALYVVSDLQRSACQSLASCPLPDQLEVKLVAVGDVLSPNLAISQLQVTSRGSDKPHVIVSNFSDEDSPDLAVDLSVDGKGAFSHSMSLRSGASTNLEVSIPALKPGWHEVKAALRTKDSLETDDTGYSALFIPEPTRVLIVEPRSTKRVFEEESFFVATALDPTKDLTNSIQATYNVTKITPDELVSKLSAKTSPPPCDVLILPGLKQIPSGSGKALSAFVQAGGGLMLFLGEGVSANRYNGEFREFLPAQIGNPDAALEAGSGWRISDFDTNTTIFAAFRLPNTGDLRIPEFTKRYTLSSMDGTSPPALFDDGVPLLVTRSVGRGRVALVNTSSDTSWNDWPKHKTFVPWLHSLGKFLAQKSGQESIQETNTFVAGADFEIEMGAIEQKAPFKIRSPQGRDISVTADEQGRLHESSLSVPGVYSLLDQNNKEVRRLAVNVPPRESDLAALLPAEFQQQLVRVRETPTTTLAAGLFGSMSNQKELWRVLLLGVLVLLFCESFVANRTTP